MSTSRRNFIGGSARGAGVGLVLDLQPSKLCVRRRETGSCWRTEVQRVQFSGNKSTRLSRAFSNSGRTSSSGLTPRQINSVPSVRFKKSFWGRVRKRWFKQFL
jgi:hypothetical protein